MNGPVPRSRRADPVRQLRVRRHTFTNDYENVLLSTRLVGDPAEWGRFPDWGTTIVEGIDQATQLFRTFDFTNASGNLMIVFTDGRDSQLSQQKAELDRIVTEARRWKIPVYMMRTAYNRREGEILQDKIWKADRRTNRRPLLRGVRR